LAHTLLAAAFGTQPPDVDRLRAEMDYPVPFKAEQLARGLVARLPLDAADFLKVGPELAAWGPVPCVGLRNLTPQLDALARCPALAAVTALDLGGVGLTDEELRVRRCKNASATG